MEDKNRRPDKMPISLPLFRNMKGADVQKLQMWLNDMNDYYLFNKKERLKETGIFNDQTIRMLKEFQKFCNLPPSGMYEARTHDLMEWKFMNMNVNIAKEMEREVARTRQKEADRLFSTRHW